MPQKLTVSDYKYYMTPDSEGAYRFREMQGNIFRKPRRTFDAIMKRMSPKSLAKIIPLYGIADVERIETGEHMLVFEVFADLRNETVQPIPRQAFLIKNLLEENAKLKKINSELTDILAREGIAVIVPSLDPRRAENDSSRD